MSKNKKLDQLFEQWKLHFPEYQKQFIKDGIIDEQFYEKQNPKLLFVTKEANDQTGRLTDFREHWNRPLLHPFDYRIGEIAYGIQNRFPAFDSIYHNLLSKNKRQYENALKSIAFMDIKKTPGKSRCDHKTLLENIKANLQFIHFQIEIIDPDVIISGLVEKELVEAAFPGIQFVRSGYARCIFKWKKFKGIDFYHPSCQSPPSAMYSLMQNIYQSEVFQSL